MEGWKLEGIEKSIGGEENDITISGIWGRKEAKLIFRIITLLVKK